MRVLRTLIIVSNLLPQFPCACNIRNFNLIAIKDNGENYNVTVNSCIDYTLFPNNPVRGLYAKDQILTNLRKGSIMSMNELEAISFDNCSIETLEKGAFNDLPRLSRLYLVRSQIKKVPCGVFNSIPSLVKVRLNYNAIDSIEDNAFANIRKLKKAYFGHNNLRTWNPRWFTNSTALEKINFEFNSMEKIQSRAFASLPKLSSINFNYNKISVVEPDAFAGVHHLKYLGLRYNRISILVPEVVPKRLTIDSLFIDANRLNFISTKTLQKIAVTNITIDGNPWKCPCLETVGNWLRSINGTVKASKHCKNSNVLQCIHLEVLHYNCVESVDGEITSIFIDAFKNQRPFDRYKEYKYCVSGY